MSGMSRTFSVPPGSGLLSSTDIPALSWADPQHLERQVQIEIVPTWLQAAQVVGGSLVLTPVLPDPTLAGNLVRARLRWSSGGASRDTTLDNVNPALRNGNLTSSAICARGNLWRLRASAVDVFVGVADQAGATARTTVVASVSIADSPGPASFPFRTYQNPFFLTALWDGNPAPLPFWLAIPQYAGEMKLHSAVPFAQLKVMAPDALTAVTTGLVASWSDWRPIHQAGVIAMCASDFRAVFR
jgi:hypothetical protein